MCRSDDMRADPNACSVRRCLIAVAVSDGIYRMIGLLAGYS